MQFFLEIGCGLNGSFLKKLVEQYHKPCTGIGYDPAYCGKENVLIGDKKKCKFIKQYFTDGSEIEQDIDMLISRHCIEHMSNPWIMLDILEMKYNIIQGGVYVETPDVRWSLKNMKWFDFGYEHCSLFAPVVFRWIADKKGFCIEKIKHTFHDQYMQVMFGRKKDQAADVETFDVEITEMIGLVNDYHIKEKEMLNAFHNKLMESKKLGKIAIWGGGGKGNVFLNLMDSDSVFIDAVIDINSEKTGKYVAGTGHKIIEPEKIQEYGIKTIFIMNENYKDEIEKKLKSMRVYDINVSVL